MQGLIARKIGMTRIFDSESGKVIPVTVAQVGVNIVQQIKTVEIDGYSAVQLGYDICKEDKVTKAELGHFKKHKSEPTRVIKEFAFDSSDEKLEPGQKIGVEALDDVRFVDVFGTSKGRGFAGTIKKYHFMLGRKTHGNTNRRQHGSIGSNTFPARTFPGVKMAGQYGNEQVTIKNLQIINIDKETGLIYLKGAIPGSNKGIICLCKSDKQL